MATERVGDVVYVVPNTWTTPQRTYVRTADLAQMMAWSTKAAAHDGARAIGWSPRSVSKVRSRLGGEVYALVDGRFGYLSRESYDRLRATKRETEGEVRK